VQPPPAEQKRSASLIDAGDDRMQQTQSAGGAVWGALGTGVTVAHDATSRAGAAWFQVRPVITGTLIRSAAMVRQGYVGALGTSLLFPALAVERSGRAVMVLSLSSGARYPSAAFTALAPGAARFADVVVAAPGTGPYDAKAERWGDYSWAVTDPAGTSVWLATEYIAPLPRQTVDRKRNWGNRVLQVH